MAPLGGVCENMLAVGWQYQGHLVDDVPRGEGVSPLRVAGILPAIRGQDALDTKEQGQDGLAT
ncbi:MAG: hypothetical protein A2Y77_07535 [Planctomycetes bacterium RBG_13_62_9]|nr:MAG: hypothetical protein A2Y77_07535 [Planctomycetes bacterium RBG_13_62_9]